MFNKPCGVQHNHLHNTWNYAVVRYSACTNLQAEVDLVIVLCRWTDVLLAPYGATDPTAFYNEAFTTVSSWLLPRLAWLDGAFQGVTANGNQIVQFSSAPADVATAG